MESCKNRFCHIVVDFIERFLKLLVSPFKPDKLLAIAGVSLVASPTFFDFNGKIKIDTSQFKGELLFTRQVDILSYIIGAVLIVLAIYIYRKRELITDELPLQQSLVTAIENKRIENQANIQFLFSSIYKFEAGVNEIERLLKMNNPALAVYDYKKAKQLVRLDGEFKLKNGVNLNRSIKIGTVGYYFFSLLALISYIWFLIIVTDDKNFESLLFLLISITFGILAYFWLDKLGIGYSAKRLIAYEDYT